MRLVRASIVLLHCKIYRESVGLNVKIERKLRNLIKEKKFREMRENLQRREKFKRKERLLRTERENASKNLKNSILFSINIKA